MRGETGRRLFTRVRATRMAGKAIRPLKNILVATAVTGSNNFYGDFATFRFFFSPPLLRVHTRRYTPLEWPAGRHRRGRNANTTTEHCVRARYLCAHVGG